MSEIRYQYIYDDDHCEYCGMDKDTNEYGISHELGCPEVIKYYNSVNARQVQFSISEIICGETITKDAETGEILDISYE